MKGFDAFAGVIKSGGKTRRAAKMVILNIDHPDIEDFIWCKAKEEKKAWALIDAGYDGSFDGEAYKSVFFQNSNNSVRVTDEFMEAVQKDREWTTRAVRDGQPIGTFKARELWRAIAQAAWECGDPGLQYDTTVNSWHTCSGTRPHQRLESVLGVHVPRQLGLQPGLAQPAQVPARRRHLRHRVLQARGRDHHPGAGDHRRQRQVPDQGHRGELAALPAARPGLRQPGLAAHVARPALRLGAGARLVRRHHRAHDRLGLPHLRGHRARRDRARSPATPRTSSRSSA